MQIDKFIIPARIMSDVTPNEDTCAATSQRRAKKRASLAVGQGYFPKVPRIGS